MRLRLATLPSHRTHHACQKQRSAVTLRIPFEPQQRSDIERILLILEDCRTANRSQQDRPTIKEDSMKIEIDGSDQIATR